MERSYDELAEAIDEGKALYSAEHAAMFDDAAYPSLVAKIEGLMRTGGYSGKMVAIMARILGQHWTNPDMQELSVTSDGFLTEAFGGFLGGADSLDHNLELVVGAAELDEREMTLMLSLARAGINRFDDKVTLAAFDHPTSMDL